MRSTNRRKRATPSRGIQAKNEAFRRWFGDSKVVDENGEPLVVYHGTPDVRGIFAGGFRKSPTRGGVYFATDDVRTAETYTDPHRAWDYQNAEPGVIPLYLSIKKPFVIDAKFKHWRGTEQVIRQAIDAGNDGVIILNTIDHYATPHEGRPRREDASTVFAWFSPMQAKSALDGPMRARDPNRWHLDDPSGRTLEFTGPNDGTFDPQNPDVRRNPHDDGGQPSVDLDFRGGDCAILALRMNELSGLPLVGLFDERGDLHHVAIRLRAGWVLDVDGPASMKARADQFRGIGEKRWRTTDPEEVQRQLPGWSGYGDEELDVVDEEASAILDAAGLNID